MPNSVRTTFEKNLARNANSGLSDHDNSSSSQSKKPEKSIHGSSIHSQCHLDEFYDDDEEHDDDDGASVEHAFSVVSFSLHRHPSAESALTVSTVRGGSKTASVALTTGEKGLYKSGSGSVKGKEKADKGNISWWTRIRGIKDAEDAEQAGDKDLKALEADSNAHAETEEDIYPDGGLMAWTMVLGALLNTFSTFGYVNSWGIFQSYYQSTILKDSTPSNIAWIGSIQYALVFFPAILIGRLFDLGYFRSIFVPCSIVLVVATFLVAECHVYWQFLLCQGFAVGLACGGIFGPTTAVIAHWFKKRRGLAMGIVAMGSSLGGTTLPIAVKNLIPQVGFEWTMRILGFILMFSLIISNIVLKRRLPPKNLPGGLLNLSAFQSPAYTIYCLSAFTIFLGLYTVLTYIDVAAPNVHGISVTLSFYMLPIANASSLVGRYVSGMISDRVGPMNVMIPFTVLAGVMTFIWPYARTVQALVAVAIVYGFSSGAYVSLLSNPLMDLGDTSDVGRRIGMFMSILALGALAGPPISGAINTATGGFVAVGWFAGSTILLGVAMMSIARRLVLKKWRGRM